MIYAPILITTLNRFDAFKACLESLELCTGASNSEVFISLDFPPTDKYVEGWKKIDSYLKIKEVNNRFKKIVVFRRNYNLGLVYPCTNLTVLRDEIISRGYDRWIITEDDNVFSPNFLEYINKGLELYKNDKRIVGICGYKNDFICKHTNNNNFAQHSLFQAWGVGMWANRYHELHEKLTPKYFRSIVYSHKKWYKCYKYWPHWFMLIVRNAMSHLNYLYDHDTNLGFYLINENKCVICPTVSKVRNMGWGELSTTTFLEKGNLRERAELELNKIIDTDDHFEYIGDPYAFEEENSLEIAKWDGKWETNRMRSLFRIYPRILAFRLLALLGIV